MSVHRIRGIATLVGVSALVLAGPTAAAVADSDLQTFGDQPSQGPEQAEGDQEWSLDRSREAEDTDDQQESHLGSLTERGDAAPREAASDAGTASGPGEDFCDAAFADNEDAHAQCMQVAESLPSEEGGDEGGAEEDPFQQLCDEAFADNEDAHAQCTEFAGTLSEDDGDGEDDGGQDDTTEDDGGQDDSTDDGAEQDNPFQQFCDEAFADNEDAHAQCSELAGNFDEGEGGDGGQNPFQQFCDEAFADNEDAHAQCSELAQTLAGEEEQGGDGGDDTTDEEEETGGADDSDTLAESVSSPGGDSDALPVTGLNLAVAGLSSLSLLGLGGALLRRFRADSLA